MRAFALAVCALLLVPSRASAFDIGRPGFDIAPSALLEGDYQLHSNDIEGYDGFSLSRARMGVVATLFDWAELHFLGEWAREDVSILDAYVSARIGHQVTVTVGYARNPLFITGRDEWEYDFAIPQRSMTAQALWPGRDVGIEVHWAPPRVPLETWFRVGNGGNNVLGNDNDPPALTWRVDLALGRTHAFGDHTQWYGLRVGAGVYLDWAPERLGVTVTTPLGFEFALPPDVTGFRAIAEWHALFQAGPLQVTAEAGVAREDRARSVNGNPNTPLMAEDPALTAGMSVEAAWMLTGERRVIGMWPAPHYGDRFHFGLGAWELAARVERLVTSVGTSDLHPGGAYGESVALHWWANELLALALAAYVEQYDAAPIGEPGNTLSWQLLARATLRVL